MGKASIQNHLDPDGDLAVNELGLFQHLIHVQLNVLGSFSHVNGVELDTVLH